MFSRWNIYFICEEDGCSFSPSFTFRVQTECDKERKQTPLALLLTVNQLVLQELVSDQIWLATPGAVWNQLFNQVVFCHGHWVSVWQVVCDNHAKDSKEKCEMWKDSELQIFLICFVGIYKKKNGYMRSYCNFSWTPTATFAFRTKCPVNVCLCRENTCKEQLHEERLQAPRASCRDKRK